MLETLESVPVGRVHPHALTGTPWRWVGRGVGAGEIPELLPEAPPASAFFAGSEDQWYEVHWDIMTRKERKLYKRQYPVV